MKKSDGYKFFLISIVLLAVVTLAISYFDKSENILLSSDEFEDLGEDGASAIGSAGGSGGRVFCGAGSNCGVVGNPNSDG